MTPFTLCIATLQISTSQARAERKCGCRAPVKHPDRAANSFSRNSLPKTPGTTNTLPIIEMRPPSNFTLQLTRPGFGPPPTPAPCSPSVTPSRRLQIAPCVCAHAGAAAVVPN